MTEMTKHEPGMLCWADLATSDPAGARRFYGALFGWDLRDDPFPGGVYTQALIGGKPVAAMSAMQPELAKQGVPPHWNAYIAVTSADEIAKKAAAAGGKVVAGPFDVMEQGRMAVLQDPTGAMLSVWQPAKHIGAGRVNEPRTLCWAELMTRDTRTAGDFYAKVFGWTREEMPGMNYTVFNVGDRGAVGMMETPKEAAGIPPVWSVYFAVTDCDRTVAETQRLGGQVFMPPKDIPEIGRFAVLGDPQGAAFCILQPAQMP